MKKILLIVILLFTGCTITQENETPNIYKPVYRPTYIDNGFKKYNLRYKMLVVETRWYGKNKKEILETRKVIKSFGDSLGQKAIVQNLIMKSSKKRIYLNTIQKKLNTYYNLDKHSPFLIFFKHNTVTKKYEPYQMIALSSLSLPYLKKQLLSLGNAIRYGKSNKQIYANLKKIELNSKKERIVKRLANILKRWFS